LRTLHFNAEILFRRNVYLATVRAALYVVLNLPAIVHYFVVRLLNFIMTTCHSFRTSHFNAGMLIRWNIYRLRCL